ncbi:MAG: hypothetical protein ACLSHO_08995 [Dysosmobacter sp.]
MNAVSEEYRSPLRLLPAGSRSAKREVACVKHGIVPVEHHCRGFHYDPLKRVPPRPASLDTAKLKEEDFSL